MDIKEKQKNIKENDIVVLGIRVRVEMDMEMEMKT